MNGDMVEEIRVSKETLASIAKLKSNRPVTEILNFNPERRLNFDPEREWDFSLDRDLNFDMERKLDFDPERELDFGHNSIFFRGYLCPNCKRQVARDTTVCSICGATYKKPLRVGWRETTERSDGDSKSEVMTQKIQKSEASPPRKEHKKSMFKFCPICKMKNPLDATYCVECGRLISEKNIPGKKGGG